MKRRFVVPLIFDIGALVALVGRTARGSLADYMKMCINRQFILSVLVVCFGVMLAGPLPAQTFTVLDSLTTVYGGVVP